MVRTLVAGVGVAAWIAAPIAGVFVLSSQATTAALEPALVTWVPVENNSGAVSRPVSVHVAWADTTPLVAPSWTGVVQRTFVRSGSGITSGDPIAIIDGIKRLAIHTNEPFYRTLTVGDHGGDVAAFNRMLIDLGFEADNDDQFTYMTQAGLRAFAKSIGVPAARDVTSFDPSWVVFLAQRSVNIETFQMLVGAPAPSVGTEIAEVEPSISSARLVERSDLTANEEGEIDENLLNPAIAEPEESLSVAGEKVNLHKDRESVAPKSLLILRELLQVRTPLIDGQLSAPAEAGEWAVPAASVITGPDGGHCLAVRTLEGHRTIPAQVEGNINSVAIVQADLMKTDYVAVRPPTEMRQCISR
jgi:hypothetical protein